MVDKQEGRRREPRKEASTREKIISAAGSILAEEGSGAISTRHVADRAGVNQALVHYHFGSVENLMLEVLRGTTARAMATVQAQYGGPRDFVDKWLEDLGPVAQQDPTFGPKSWLEIMGIVVNDDSLLDVYKNEFVDPNFEIVRDAVTESLSRSVRPDDETVEVIASYALVIRAGVFITYLIGRNPGLDRAIELSAKFLRDYIDSLGPDGRPPAGTGPVSGGAPQGEPVSD